MKKQKRSCRVNSGHESEVMKKRSVSIRGHRTSLSLEDVFWDELGAMARARDISVAGLIAEIDSGRMARGGPASGLSSAVRIYVVEHLKRR